MAYTKLSGKRQWIFLIVDIAQLRYASLPTSTHWQSVPSASNVPSAEALPTFLVLADGLIRHMGQKMSPKFLA